MRRFKNKLLFFFIFSVVFSNYTTDTFAQVVGCKDPLALNYNPSATVNDGSCMYATTSYIPPTKVNPMNALLIESSGLQWAGNSLWSFNDGGGNATIYRIDTTSSAVFQTVNIGGATNVDWEDIAFDGTYFYIGDFGNNANGARTDLKIYRFPISAIPDYTTDPVFTVPTSMVEVINYTYADQVPVVATAANATKYDCEAMIVDAGKIHLFSKNWVDTSSTHYVINSLVAGTYVALPQETLPTGYLVTAADKAVGQELVTLLGYHLVGTPTHYMHLLSDYSGGNYFNGNKRKIDLQSVFFMGQAEGITFRNATYGYISNERVTALAVNQQLKSFNVSNFVSTTVLATDLSAFTVKNVSGGHQLSWRFNAAVKNLQVQLSADGNTFNTIKSYSNSTGEEFIYNSNLPVAYYRLSWQSANNSVQYSNTISIKNNGKSKLLNVALNANGELSFNLNSNATSSYAFTIATIDGKIITQTAARAFTPGANKVQLAKTFSGSIFITAIAEYEKFSQLVWVTR